jgi:hypothetical protein
MIFLLPLKIKNLSQLSLTDKGNSMSNNTFAFYMVAWTLIAIAEGFKIIASIIAWIFHRFYPETYITDFDRITGYKLKDGELSIGMSVITKDCCHGHISGFDRTHIHVFIPDPDLDAGGHVEFYTFVERKYTLKITRTHQWGYN